MNPKFNFAEWLKQEMTSVASVGGGSFTNDIAHFARPLFSGEMVRRNWEEEEPEKKKKKRKN